jgi:hypothetical protein
MGLIDDIQREAGGWIPGLDPLEEISTVIANDPVGDVVFDALGEVGDVVVDPISEELNRTVGGRSWDEILSGGGTDLSDAQARQLQAQQNAIAAQEEMYRRGLEIGEPYRQLGYDVLPAMRESLGPDSDIGTFRSKAAQQFIAQRLGQHGFNPRAAGSIGNRAVRSAQAGEDVARRGRIRDIMNLGMGQAATGMGMTGRQGPGMAQQYLHSANLISQQQAERAAARQAGQAGAVYGLTRGTQDIIAERAADRARGYYG